MEPMSLDPRRFDENTYHGSFSAFQCNGLKAGVIDTQGRASLSVRVFWQHRAKKIRQMWVVSWMAFEIEVGVEAAKRRKTEGTSTGCVYRGFSSDINADSPDGLSGRLSIAMAGGSPLGFGKCFLRGLRTPA